MLDVSHRYQLLDQVAFQLVPIFDHGVIDPDAIRCQQFLTNDHLLEAKTKKKKNIKTILLIFDIFNNWLIEKDCSILDSFLTKRSLKANFFHIQFPHNF